MQSIGERLIRSIAAVNRQTTTASGTAIVVASMTATGSISDVAVNNYLSARASMMMVVLKSCRNLITGLFGERRGVPTLL